MKKDDITVMHDKFRQATCHMLILRTLCPGPKYVYQIISEISSKSDKKYAFGFAYPLLRRLMDEGLVAEHTTLSSNNLRPRIYYEITDAGREHLQKLRKQYCRLVEITENIWDAGEQEKDEKSKPRKKYS